MTPVAVRPEVGGVRSTWRPDLVPWSCLSLGLTWVGILTDLHLDLGL